MNPQVEGLPYVESRCSAVALGRCLFVYRPLRLAVPQQLLHNFLSIHWILKRPQNDLMHVLHRPVELVT